MNHREHAAEEACEGHIPDLARPRAEAEAGAVLEQALHQDALNIANKSRSNPLPWRGQFSPQLVEALLRMYSRPHGVVLDPFGGSGTVLHECARLGLTGLATEINPAAATMARTYELCMLPPAKREALLNDLSKTLQPLFSADLPLFKSPKSEEPDLRPSLIGAWKDIPNRTSRIPLETLICLTDFYQGPPTAQEISSTWRKLVDLILSLPHSRKPIEVALCDARSLPLAGKCVDLVVTSPPYINVFNYHQQFRASMEALGWNLLAVARSEIGANRKHRSNRLLTVIQYCIDMASALAELRRVGKPDLRVVMVVGRESNVRKTAFYNGKMIGRLAVECSGFELVLEQERVFKNKFGQEIYEELLHLIPRTGDPATNVDLARQVGVEVLRQGIVRAPADVVSDFEEAIEGAGGVVASPRFQGRAAKKGSMVPSRFMKFSRSRA